MENELDKMFTNYSDRKQREKEDQDEKDVKQKAFQEKAKRIINEVISPVLNSLCVDIQQRGHGCEISFLVDRDSYPSVNMSFCAESEDIHTHTSASMLSFSAISPRDGLEARKEIVGKNGRERGGFHEALKNRKLLEAVTPEWVREQALSFVEAVLDKQ